MTVRLSGLVGFAIYLGIGALFHAIFVGPHFDWSSAWTFGWLLGWPVMLFVTFWVVVLALFVAGIVTVVIIVFVEAIKERNRLRRQREMMKGRIRP